MTRYLLDTNCISEVVRVKPEPSVLAWLDSVDEASLHLSVLTIGEMRKGIESLGPDHRRRADLTRWFEVDVRNRFKGRIIPVTIEVAERWGALLAELKRAGTPMPAIDAMLAATALCLNLTLVTRNSRDFQNAGLTLHNPWGDP